MANDPLGGLRIAAPCTASWEGMAGDVRVRHCSLCSLNVYNFAEMTAGEVRELLVRTEGRVCARMYRRADGTVLTRDCPTGIRALRRRASRAATALVAALLSLPGLAFGGTSCNPRLSRGANMKLTVEKVAASQPAVLTGVVRFDRDLLPGVTVVVKDEATKREVVAVTHANGAFSIAALQGGVYRVEVMLSGFTTATIEHLEVETGEVIHASVDLKPSMTETVMMGAVTSVITTDSAAASATTLSAEEMRKLPF